MISSTQQVTIYLRSSKKSHLPKDNLTVTVQSVDVSISPKYPDDPVYDSGTRKIVVIDNMSAMQTEIEKDPVTQANDTGTVTEKEEMTLS
ncbi:hypothetical protein DUI87_21316 [Hirundo rustica rustica]|uniref:Uncharacterized protein n=1 Tax=Hirundo rustica rustica TaxID=333673 RepID=A0A3M0JMR1_HIRRU|nr:hypothetical protein DUI87_21316 [Hirundo rustica rustica]